MGAFWAIIIDKSVLQGLAPREAEWLFHHLRVNMPPVFFHELIGDLKKSGPSRKFSTGSPDGDVRMLSGKISSWAIDLNIDAYDIAIEELRGRHFPMDGRPIVAAERVRDSSGGFGAFVDMGPMQRVLDRWCAGDFNGMEAEFAKAWRDRLSEIDLEKLVSEMKHLRIPELARSAEAIVHLIDTKILRSDHRHATLMHLLRILPVPTKFHKVIIDHWRKIGMPDVDKFCPYVLYYVRLELFFYWAVLHGVVTTRKSNKIDVEYFRYLPFCKIFSSSDSIHRDLFSHFARSDQIFIDGRDLKASLSEMASYYDNLPAETRRLGSATYAEYPPVCLDNAITRAFDNLQPGWRDGANQPRAPISAEENARIMERLKPMMEALEARDRRR